jgi:hypothetical protein
MPPRKDWALEFLVMGILMPQYFNYHQGDVNASA